MQPKEMSFAEFARLSGGADDHEVFMHINAALRSKPTTKSFQRNFDKELDKLIEKSLKTKEAYFEKIASGEIIAPQKPTLEEIALGLPELRATQAAIRVLEKRKQRELEKQGLGVL